MIIVKKRTKENKERIGIKRTNKKIQNEKTLKTYRFHFAEGIKNKFTIPTPSRTIKFKDAERADAPALPTPIASRTRCVASTDRKLVERSCIAE